MRTLFIFLLSITLFSCSQEEEEKELTFKRQALVDNIINYIALPSTSRFTVVTEEFNSVVSSFKNTPTKDNFITVRNKWKECLLAWQDLSPFSYGPISTEKLHYAIHFWPDRDEQIRFVLDGTDEINAEFIQNAGAAKTGIPVLEYILFQVNKSEDEIFILFTSDTSASRRMNYLFELSIFLNEKARVISDEWESNTATAFKTQNTSEDDHLNQLMNTLIDIVEECRNKKIGKVLGIGSSSGNTRPYDCEAQYAGYSWEAIEQKLKQAERVFNGNSFEGIQGIGFDDFIAFKEAKAHGDNLENVINNQFIKVFIKITKVKDKPLYWMIDNEKDKVQEVYDEITVLYEYLKVNMVFAINGILTLGDSDGD